MQHAVALGQTRVARLRGRPVGKMQHVGRRDRRVLHLARPAATQPLVGFLRLAPISGAGLGQLRGQYHRILDRLIRALPMVRHQRVRGVAEQRHAPAAPAAERWTMEQRPALADRHGRDHLHHRRMPAPERAQLLAFLGRHDPVARRPR